MKNLAVFLDGTWCKETDATSLTNIGRLHEACANGNLTQVTFYEAGVGTDWFDKFIGGIAGLGVDERIRDAYLWLCNRWTPGDRIFIFGFSRGAFEARSLAGMVGRVGLLKPPNRDINSAWKSYRDAKAFPARAIAFKAANSFDAPIAMLGCFDTVGALGIPLAFTELTIGAPEFHDLDLGAGVAAAYHALAIDEERKDFNATLWNQASVRPGQKLEQVWFAGSHSDVGGGYSPDHRLSDLSLGWMAANARDCGLLFTDPAFPSVAPDANAGTLHQSMNSFFESRGVVHRNIAPKSLVHASVKARLGPAYAPPNLVADAVEWTD